MEHIVLASGKKYRLATNGVIDSTDQVKLKLVTDETVEQVMEDFNPENTAKMMVVNDAGTTLMVFTGFSKRGDSITKKENAVISVKVIHEETNEAGEVVTPSGLEEVKGTIVSFSMRKEGLDDKVKQNRADIDYLLMMEEE